MKSPRYLYYENYINILSRRILDYIIFNEFLDLIGFMMNYRINL